MQWIDFRSDTVTYPTQQMREVILTCQLGDDVYGDDPITNRFEKYIADLFGKQDSMIVPSGVFGNLCAIKSHTLLGQEIILADKSHTFLYENGNVSGLCRCMTKTIQTLDGIMKVNDIQGEIRKDKLDLHQPQTGLICIQTPTSFGSLYELQDLQKIYKIGKKYKIPIHIDGARIFNASTSLNVQVKDIAQYANSIMFCLSKALCAPIGSMLVGSTEFIKKARKFRKMMGGGMRQVGIISAMGQIAVKKLSKEIKIDHQIAQLLYQKLSRLNKITVKKPQINMIFIYFKVNVQVDKLKQKMALRNIKVLKLLGNDVLRLLTHHYIRQKQVDLFMQVFQQFLEKIE